MPSTTAVVIDRGRGGMSSLRVDRSLAQVGLVALMVLAFVVLAVARLTSDGSDRRAIGGALRRGVAGARWIAERHSRP